MMLKLPCARMGREVDKRMMTAAVKLSVHLARVRFETMVFIVLGIEPEKFELS